MKLGVIESASFGFGGYQDCCLGLCVDIKISDGGHVSGWIGEFAHDGKHLEEDVWVTAHGKAMCKIAKVLNDAKVRNPADLRGVPVRMVFDGMRMQEWKIATELIP